MDTFLVLLATFYGMYVFIGFLGLIAELASYNRGVTPSDVAEFLVLPFRWVIRTTAMFIWYFVLELIYIFIPSKKR